MLPPLPHDDKRNPQLAAALVAAGERLPPERVEQVWVFPPRRVGARESGLAVLVVTPDDGGAAGPARRTIHTLRYELEPGRAKSQRVDVLEEQGTVPPDRVGRIVDGVVRRLEVEAEAPDVRELAGDVDAWRALIAELGGASGG